MWCGVILAVGLSLAGQVAADERPEPVTAEAIARAIEELGDVSFAVRERATRLLWGAGLRAEGPLREALKSTDPEVRVRARSVLDKLRFGIAPDTPPETLVLIDQFRYGNTSAKRQALTELQSKGHWPVILALLRSEENETQRKTFAAILAAESGKLLRPLLESGQLDDAAQILELTSNTDTGQPQLAAFLLLTGRLDARIVELEAAVAASSRASDWRQLALLLRAKGEASKAADAAIQTGDDRLQLALLAEAARWRDAGLLAEAMFHKNVEQLDLAAMAATYFRLAGNDEDYEQMLDVMATACGANKTDAGFDVQGQPDPVTLGKVWILAEALLVNEQFERALPLLRRTHPAPAHTLLWRRHQHADALALLGIEKDTELDRAWFDASPAGFGPAGPTSNLQLATQAARQLRELGRKDQLDQLLETMRRATAANPDSGRRWVTLATLQWQLGRYDEAFADAHQAIAARQPPAAVFSSMLRQQGPLAAVWYEYLTNSDPPGNREQQIATSIWLVVAQPPAGRLPDNWRTIVAEAAAAGEKLEAWHRAQRLFTVGQTWLARGERDEARKCLEEAAERLPAAALKAGDVAAQDGRWSDAAAWYAKAGAAGDDLLATYLAGHALAQAGEREAGEAKMRVATLGALSPEARLALATGLAERGLREQAAEQLEAVRRTALPQSAIVVQAAQQLGNLVSGNEPRRAAGCWRQLLLHVLNRTSTFTETEGYLSLPHVIHKVQARAALAEDDFAACERELAACGKLLPGDVQLVVEFVPRLDRAGRREAADALFEQSFAAHHAVCEAFPESATYLNNTAWLVARSQRRLDEGLRLVERALALAPQEAAYLDTLAEIHFQLGDRDAAVAAAQRAADSAPHSALFQRRLKHFQESELKTLDRTNE